MILPSKHIRLSESLLGVGGVIISLTNKSKDLDVLWARFEGVNNTDILPAYHDYDDFILAIDLLYAMNLINLNNEGNLITCN